MFDIFGAAVTFPARDALHALAVSRELAMVEDVLATGGNFEDLY